jgi:serine/threonine protein kinase
MALSSKLGHFNLIEEIAHGGMGTVFRAFDPTLNREVAIKVLREDLAHDPKFLNDFLQEARSAAAISHPHIVQIYFVGEESSQYYIVMELLKGRTLREIVERIGPMKEEEAIDMTIDVIEGLRAAYNRNQMIHGDIKPANIFIADDVGVKILDFGLSKLANVEVAPDQGIWGSPYYISPERVGQKAEDFRSDVYSMGATLFQMLTGHPPFEAETPEELAAKRLNEKPPLLRELNPDITAKTEQVVNKMLNKSILLRYRDYDALLVDLKEAKTEATAKRLGVDLHPQFQPPPPAPRLQTQSSPLPLIITTVIVVLLIVAAVAYFFWPRNPSTSTPAPSSGTTPSTEVSPTPTPAPTPTPSPAPTPPKPKPSRPFNVEFSLSAASAPDAHTIRIAGDFNSWNAATATPMRKLANGDWDVTLQLPAGRHLYKLIVDGKWIPDPENTMQADDGYGGTNSVVMVGK